MYKGSDYNSLRSLTMKNLIMNYKNVQIPHVHYKTIYVSYTLLLSLINLIGSATYK